MPAALYPRGKKLQFVTRSSTGITDSEMRAHLLCRACEMRFDQNGESDVLFSVAPKVTARHPLSETLRKAHAKENYSDFEVFSGPGLGLDMDKFAYFALSVAWRASIHDWAMPDGNAFTPIALGDFAEDMRRYLAGKTPFPSDFAVIIIVCSDDESRKMWIVPEAFMEANCLNVRFITRGIMFRVVMGHQMPQLFRDMSCVGPRKCLLYGNAKHRVKDLFDRLDGSVNAT